MLLNIIHFIRNFSSPKFLSACASDSNNRYTLLKYIIIIVRYKYMAICYNLYKKIKIYYTRINTYNYIMYKEYHPIMKKNNNNDV